MKNVIASTLLTAATLSHALSVPQVFHDALENLQNPLGSQERYLIELGPDERRWVTEAEKWALKRGGRKFFDITEFQEFSDAVRVQETVTFPDSLAQNDSIAPLLDQLEKDNMYDNLKTFSGFHTRYYKSSYGRKSSEWLYDQVNKTLEDAGQVGLVQFFEHDWEQNSIIAIIPGKSDKTVVIGAHQDSVNMFLPSILPAPGADDDGSGTVTILEALRVLLQDERIISGEAENTIEFHWYSAEEGGLLGSQAIFSSYEEAGRDVKAMLQQDMTGYTRGTFEAGQPESVGVVTDYVDTGLTEFTKKVVGAYCNIPYVETKCGYACSDHASASKAGYPSAFVIESDFKYADEKIHTSDDKIEYLDFDHMLQHARLALGLAYELAFAKFD
jgi:leucyl aminopeptidase